MEDDVRLNRAVLGVAAPVLVFHRINVPRPTAPTAS